MELFERVQKVKKIAGSYSNIAAAMGITPNNFSYYCRTDRQNHLWALLPKLLEAYPGISRQWLYFEEGEMLESETSDVSVKDILKRQSVLIEQILDNQRRLAEELIKEGEQ